MKKITKKLLSFVMLTVMLAVAAVVGVSASAEDGKWVGAWGSGMTEVGLGGYENIGVIIGDVTCRSVITPTMSGDKIRIKLSNVYGTAPVKIRRVTVAESTGGAKIDSTSDVKVYFKGVRNVTIPVGKEVYSDPIDFKVTALEDIAVSIYMDEMNEVRTCGFSGGESYITKGNETTSKELGAVCIKMKYGLVSVVPLLSAVDVYTTDEDAYSVVVIGDSTVANDFPEYLAKELIEGGTENVGVVGKGIIGNSLLPAKFSKETEGGIGQKIYGHALLERFDIDALAQSGVKYVVLKIGCNDIVHPKSGENATEYGMIQPTADEMIEGYTKLADKCHAAGVKLVMVQIGMWKGYTRDFFGTGPKYTFDDEDWAIAQEINEWIAVTNIFDATVDLNSCCVDANDSAAIAAKYTEDGAHPNDDLQQLWAKVFPVSATGVQPHLKGIQLNKAKLRVDVDDGFQLKATILPSDYPNKNVKWYSDNETIATVSDDGYVVGLKSGTAVITCESENGQVRARCIVTVHCDVSSVKLDKTEVTLYETQTLRLNETVKPSGASNKEVKWTSSDTSVAKVSSTGKITAIEPGTAVITCTTVDGKKTAKCNVTVIEKIDVEGLTLNKRKSKSITVGKTYQFLATITPANASNKDVTWTSSDESIFTVDKNGIITAKEGGNAILTCKSKDNGIYATVKIKVISPVTSIVLNKKTSSVYEDRTRSLTATCYPATATNKAVIWTSGNPVVATVTDDGIVIAKKPGKAVITATAADGKGASASCTITVKEYIDVKKITLNRTEHKKRAGLSFTLKATISPENASTQTLKWKSSNTKVATVNSKGVVKTIAPGVAVITCSSTALSKATATCKVTVIKYPVESVSLNKTSVTLNAGKTTTLKATVKPDMATDKSVKWSSSNPSVAKVSSTGVVTAVAPGKATITCKTNHKGFTATCKVTVNKVAVESVTLDRKSAELLVGATLTLKHTVSPSYASNKEIIWRSFNPEIATVNQNGVVTALKAGTALITCSSVENQKLTGACLVTVKDIKAIGYRLNATSVALSKGGTYTLFAEILPANATDRSMKWYSEDTSIVKVTDKGVVTAVGSGVTYVVVSNADGSVLSKCKFIVK